MFFYVSILAVSPLICLYYLFAALMDKNYAFMGFSQLMSLLPGRLGNYLRRAFYRHVMSGCHPDTSIGFATLFSQPETEIESGVYIGPQCNIGKSLIKKNCLLGSGVHILSGKNQHNFSDVNRPVQEQGGSYQKVTIGEDTWIGNGAIVMANVGKKCVVAAGAVVIGDVEDYSIVAGNPAKLIRSRSVDNQGAS